MTELKADAKEWTRVELEILTLKSDMPLHYVRREDYVRGQSILEAKMDALNERLSTALATHWSGVERVLSRKDDRQSMIAYAQDCLCHQRVECAATVRSSSTFICPLRIICITSIPERMMRMRAHRKS
ncbi:hypothetical protein QF000_000524 [Paraburkholderia atlantica]